MRRPPVPGEGWEPGNKGETYPKVFLTQQDVVAMLDACGGGKGGARKAALVAFLYRTGVNQKEALDRTLSDLDLTPGAETVRVCGTRGRAERTLALDDFAMRYLRPWLEIRSTLPGQHLFCPITTGSHGDRLWDAYVPDMLKKLAAKAQVRGNVTSSAFRNTLAAELLSEGWPFHYLQTQFGMATLYGFQGLIDELGIEPPEDVDIQDLMRTRPPVLGTDAP